MAAPSWLAALREFEVSSDPTSQLDILRALKNAIVGHALRKELAVRHGLLLWLRTLLSRTEDDDGEIGRIPPIAGSIDEQVHVQATLIIATLARDGAPFSAPLRASGLIDILFRQLESRNKPSVPQAIASLRALSSYVSANNSDIHVDSTTSLLELSRPGFLQDLVALLTDADPSRHQDRILIGLVCRLLTAAAHTLEAKYAIVSSGVLKILPTYFSVAGPEPGLTRLLTTATVDPGLLSCVLDALSAILDGSPYLTFRFVLSLQVTKLSLSSLKSIHLALPQLPPTRPKPVSKAFPAPLPKPHRTVEYPEYVLQSSDPLRQWLLILAREFRLPAVRLSALRLLARISVVSHASLEHPRHKGVGLLAVPLVVKLIRDASLGPTEDSPNLAEDAPRVLADLVGNNPLLQKAAADAGAIKYLCVLFKQTFKPVQVARSAWSASPDDETMASDPSCVLGPPGLPDELVRVTNTREACLLALRSTAVVRPGEVQLDSSIVACISDCLVPMTESPSRDREQIVAGNSTHVILAACALLREIAKNTSQARTSLVDAAVAKPLMQLVTHSDIEVRTAATWVCSNLLTPVSSLRQELVDLEIMPIMIGYAKDRLSSDPTLQQASLWALRHLAADQTKELRLEILERFGTDFILSSLQGSTRDLPDQHFSSPNAFHRSVDLLHTQSDPSDALMSEDDPDDDHDHIMKYIMTDSYNPEGMKGHIAIFPTLPKTKSFLKQLQHFESNRSVRIMREHDMLQNQILLLLANICLPPSSDDILDYLNSTVGMKKILDILSAKLEAPIMDWELYSSLQQGPTQDGSPSLAYAVSNQVIFAALKLLCHLAGASERYLAPLIEHKAILTAFMRHITHADSQIRVLALWIVLNLTLPEVADVPAARRRAAELRAIGIEERVKSAMHDPDSQDVRERAKTVLRQLDHLK